MVTKLKIEFIILILFSLIVVRTVQFSKSTFFGSEVSGFVNVTLLLQGGPSSAGITVIVNTSDQSPLSAEGKWYMFKLLIR